MKRSVSSGAYYLGLILGSPLWHQTLNPKSQTLKLPFRASLACPLYRLAWLAELMAWPNSAAQRLHSRLNSSWPKPSALCLGNQSTKRDVSTLWAEGSLAIHVRCDSGLSSDGFFPGVRQRSPFRRAIGSDYGFWS